ncbi:hypothetical protein [Dyadobacter luticola]|uniref:Uncharacterized protein n=1 Tax=Dyadobacter luticola TaxID=1979387 RepID=A0A5R9KZ38_9BACT|nr:hypothetical protein [Dyadobacter luticola]TLV01357.1 hypothetical protein FEN17_18150 [Dyadobacter luticola]
MKTILFSGILWLLAATCFGQSSDMELTNKLKEKIALACKLTDKDQIQRMQELHQTLFKKIDKTLEGPASYELVFQKPDSTLSKDLFEFIQFERLCCPWLRFQLTFSPGDGPVLLRMGDSVETKEMVYLVMELDKLPNKH